MKVGIVGTGNIGSNLARLAVSAGHEVLLSFSRTKGKLESLAGDLGDRASTGTPADAARFGDMVVLSIHYAALDDALSQMGDLNGAVLVDTGNPVDISLPEGMNGAQEVARRRPGARVVKAFNTLYYETLLSGAHADPPLVMPLCGDDVEAKETVSTLIREVGFVPLDLGRLAEASIQESGGPFFNRPLTEAQARALTSQAEST